MVRHRLTVILTVMLMVVPTLIMVIAAGPAAAQGDAAEYLALGESIAFGYSPLLDKHDAANFIGYPDVVAATLNLHLTNPSCPGEASGGFISLTGRDYVCRPYRAANPLHVAYTTSQLDFAIDFLHSHPRTQLVSISIASNDFNILRDGCMKDYPGDPAAVQHCITAGLPAVQDTVAANLETIYARIRGEGRYQGPLVAVTNYATDYREIVPPDRPRVNPVLTPITQKYCGVVADSYGTFLRAAAPFGGDSCAAGLLIRLSPSSCDTHPTLVGRDLVAGAVLQALGRPNPFFIRRIGDG
jgi:hypothetical protein